jgi:hypothetical protein
MPNPAPRLSFGDTSAASLVASVRTAPQLRSGDSPDWALVEASISTRADELVRTFHHMAHDAPGEQWLRTSSLILAAYEALKPLVGGPEVLALFRDAMAAPFREQISSYLEGRFGISEDAPHEAFTRIAANFQKRGEQRFGLAFRYAADIHDEQRSFVNIERCFFNDFFRANQAAEVTSLFCALDKVWAEALEDPRYRVRFERPTTLARGDDACRFQFSKTEP